MIMEPMGGTVAASEVANGRVHQIDGADRGFLVLADISGFTAFTTATELEHGAAVIGDLLGEVMGALSPPLEIQELEGDAVFALGPDRRLPPGAPLLPLLARAYEAFRARQGDLEADPSCGCRACSRIGMLSLKLIVHHGRFVRQRVGGRSRVGGPDVILAHLLLKNEVEGQAYILLTATAAARLGEDPFLVGTRPLTARYPHFGEVTCVVLALESVGALLPGADLGPVAVR